MDEFPNGANMIVAVLAYTGISPLKSLSKPQHPHSLAAANLQHTLQRPQGNLRLALFSNALAYFSPSILPNSATPMIMSWHVLILCCSANTVTTVAGYDMEDAMILNKSAVERGLAHGTVIKSETVDLRDDKGRNMFFAAENAGPRDQYTAQVSALGQEYPQNIPSQPGSEATSSQRIVKQVTTAPS